MSASRKIGITLVVLLSVVIVGAIGLSVIEQSVKASYPQLSPNNPCVISGSTFDTTIQEVQCEQQIAAKAAEKLRIERLANSLAGASVLKQTGIGATNAEIMAENKKIFLSIPQHEDTTITPRQNYWLVERQGQLQEHIQDNNCEEIQKFITSMENHLKKSTSIDHRSL